MTAITPFGLNQEDKISEIQNFMVFGVIAIIPSISNFKVFGVIAVEM